MAEPDDVASGASELAAALRKPAEWTKDGLGIRGPQTDPHRSPNPDADEKRHSDQPKGAVVREAVGGGKGKGEGDPQSQSDEKIYGAYNGQPASINVVVTGGWVPLDDEEEE